MKKFPLTLRWVLVCLAMQFLSGTAHAQLYTKFGPVTGVLKGNVSTPQTSAATSSDILGLWSGCTATKFLQGDGACAQVNLATEVTGQLPVANGGTGVATLAVHGVLLGQGTSNVSTVAAMAADTLLQGKGATSDPAAVAVNNCGSATTALSYSTSTHTFGCQTITAGTGSVTSVGSGTGVTASPNPIIATGTLAIDQTSAFTPSWLGVQTFSVAPAFPAGFTGSSSVNSLVSGALINSSAGTAAVMELSLANGTSGVTLGVTGTGYTGAAVCPGLGTGQYGFMCGPSSTSIPLDIAVGGSRMMRILGGAAGTITAQGPTAAGQVDMTPDKGSFTGTFTGMTATTTGTVAWAKMGNVAILSFGAINGTSNTTAMTMTGLVAEMQPATQSQDMPCNIVDAGVNVSGACVITAASGTITFQKIVPATGAFSSVGFTNTGTKGVNGTSITYTLQ